MINILQIELEHPFYQQERDLRNEVLLRPIGLPDFAWEMNDKKAYHFVAESNGTVVGCAILVPVSAKESQLMQMAILPNFQKKGIGKLIVLKMIDFAMKQSIPLITCHSRQTAVKFYQKLNFEIFGEPFEEAGIAHRHMRCHVYRTSIRFAHVNIISKNWEKLVKFYSDTFNCKIVPPLRNQSGDWLDKGTGMKNAVLKGAHLRLPGHGNNGPTIEIYQYDEIEDQDFIKPNKRGFSHIAFEVSNIEQNLRKIIDNGGSYLGELTSKEVEGVGLLKFIYTRDIEGNIIELQNWTK